MVHSFITLHLTRTSQIPWGKAYSSMYQLYRTYCGPEQTAVFLKLKLLRHYVFMCEMVDRWLSTSSDLRASQTAVGLSKTSNVSHYALEGQQIQLLLAHLNIFIYSIIIYVFRLLIWKRLDNLHCGRFWAEKTGELSTGLLVFRTFITFGRKKKKVFNTEHLVTERKITAKIVASCRVEIVPAVVAIIQSDRSHATHIRIFIDGCCLLLFSTIRLD
jgi:hypothetical protein